MIKIYQTNITAIGQVDVRDSDISLIKGGEVLTFDTADINDRSSLDVYNDTVRAQLRIATQNDTGPFFFADTPVTNSGSVAFQSTSMYSTNSSNSRTGDGSGKIGALLDEGLYAISIDVVDGYYITENTPIKTKLYVGNNGLTTQKSNSEAVVAYFIEYRKDSVVNNNIGRAFYTAGSFRGKDNIIVHKTSIDGYGQGQTIDVSTIGQDGLLGIPSDGYFSDGYSLLTSSTSIVDAIDAINESVLTISSNPSSSDSSNIDLGLPTDGSYLDGFFPFVATTSIADAIDSMNELLFAIAPAPPGNLTGQSLVVSGTTLYSAKLSSGMSANWYSGGASPGDVITSYIIDGTYSLDTPNNASRFNGGLLTNPSQLGTLTHIIDGVSVDQRDISLNGVGTTGSLTVTDISPYNNLWNKVNARVDYVNSTVGRTGHVLSHTLSGSTLETELYFSSVDNPPAFAGGPVLTVTSVVDGYLSGVQYLAPGSVINVTANAILGFSNGYHPTEFTRVSMVGAADVISNPAGIVAATDSFAMDVDMVISAGNGVGRDPPVTVTGKAPSGTLSSTSSNLSGISINSEGPLSTPTSEFFVDEDYRLVLDTTTAWDSTQPLSFGNARVAIVGSQALLEHSDVGEGVFGDLEYQRFFTKVSSSNGSLDFSGFSPSNISPFGTGNINILLQLESGTPQFYDLGRVVGDDNGTGSGGSRVDSKGAVVSIIGSSLNFSLGLNTTGGANNNRYRIIIIFKNTTETIESIISS